jgi:hypothetical protein
VRCGRRKDMGYQDKTARTGSSLYGEVTDRIVAQI